jgi:hypothetical protein
VATVDSKLHKNRTVVVAVLPNKVFWVSIVCVLNKFIIEDLGDCTMGLQNATFSRDETIETIIGKLPMRLSKTICEFDPSLEFLSSHVSHKDNCKATEELWTYRSVAKMCGSFDKCSCEGSV